MSDFLLNLRRSFTHKGFAKILDISTGMPAFFVNPYASTSQHRSSQKIAQLRYNIDQNRIGHADWDNDDTGHHYDKDHNRTGYFKTYKDKEVIFDKSWNRKGYKSKMEMLQESWWFLKCGCR